MAESHEDFPDLLLSTDVDEFPSLEEVLHYDSPRLTRYIEGNNYYGCTEEHLVWPPEEEQPEMILPDPTEYAFDNSHNGIAVTYEDETATPTTYAIPPTVVINDVSLNSQPGVRLVDLEEPLPTVSATSATTCTVEESVWTELEDFPEAFNLLLEMYQDNGTCNVYLEDAKDPLLVPVLENTHHQPQGAPQADTYLLQTSSETRDLGEVSPVNIIYTEEVSSPEQSTSAGLRSLSSKSVNIRKKSAHQLLGQTGIRSKPQTSVMQRLHEKYKRICPEPITRCPRCYDTNRTFFNICEQSHVTCTNCAAPSQKCPVCKRFQYPDVLLNLEMRNDIKQRDRFTCPGLGCLFVHDRVNMYIHLKSCPHFERRALKNRHTGVYCQFRPNTGMYHNAIRAGNLEFKPFLISMINPNDYVIVTLSKQDNTFNLYMTYFSLTANSYCPKIAMQTYQTSGLNSSMTFIDTPAEMITSLGEAREWRPHVTLPSNYVHMMLQVSSQETPYVAMCRIGYA
jgi:hypothetical protein